MKCAFNKIAQTVNIRLLTAAIAKQSTDLNTFIAGVVQLLKNKGSEFVENPEDAIEVANAARKALTTVKGVDYSLPRDLINNIDVIQNILLGHEYKPETPIRTTSDSISTESILNRKQITGDFYEDIYGRNCEEIIKRVKVQSTGSLVNAILLNRKTNRAVHTVSDLNQNIRDYQEELFNQVKDYLLTYGDFAKEIKYPNDADKLAAYKLLRDAIANLTMYDKDNNYIQNNIIPLQELGKYLSFNNIDTNTLVNKFNEADNNPESASFIQAFNAWQLLHHFDEVILQNFGDSIAITSTERFSSGNKYTLSGIASGMNRTWRSNDDIDFGEEVDNLVKLLVQTTHMWNRYGQMQNDSYLSFDLFQLGIVKIKDLIYEMPDIKLDENSLRKLGISERSIKYLADCSNLRTAINLFRLNPAENISAVLEYLTTSSNGKLQAQSVGKFTDDELDVLMTLHKGIFNQNISDTEDSSIKSICENDNSGYFNYISQISDTVCSVDQCQYYEDREGRQYLRALTNTALDSISNYVENRVRALTASAVYVDDSYKFTKKNDTYTVIIGGKAIDINTQTGAVSGCNFKTLQEVNEFIKDIYGVDLQQNKTLKTELIKTQLSANDKLENAEARITNALVTAGVKMKLVQYIQHKIFKETPNLTRPNIISKIQEELKDDFFVGNNPSLDFGLNQIKVTSVKGFLQVKEALARAVAADRKLINTSNVKDSDGKMLSKFSPSRLLAFYQTQWDSQIAWNKDKQTKFELGLLKYYIPSALEIQAEMAKVRRGKPQLTREEATEVVTKNFLRDAKRAFDAEDLQGFLIDKAYNPDAILEVIDTINSLKTAASNFALVNNRKLIKRFYTTRQWAGQGISKKYTDFNIGEFVKANFLYDYIQGIANLENTASSSLVLKNLVAFIPSVNSDKTTVSKMLIDLNEFYTTGLSEVDRKLLSENPLFPKDVNGNLANVAYKDLTTELLRALCNLQFGTYYDRIIRKRKSDLQKLENSDEYKQFFDSLGVTPPTLLGNFNLFNLQCHIFTDNQNHILYGESPYSIISEILYKYNINHQANPIKLQDLIHFINDKGDLKENESLNSLFTRFNGILNDKYPTAEEFWQVKDLEVLQSFLVNDVIIQTEESDFDKNNKATSPTGWLALNNKKWFDSKGQMIVAYLNGKPITSKADLSTVPIEKGSEETEVLDIYTLNEFEGELELNPHLLKYNTMDYLFTQQWMLSTVGTHINHPSKYKGKEPTTLSKKEFIKKYHLDRTKKAHITEEDGRAVLNLMKGRDSYQDIDFNGTIRKGRVGQVSAFPNINLYYFQNDSNLYVKTVNGQFVQLNVSDANVDIKTADWKTAFGLAMKFLKGCANEETLNNLYTAAGVINPFNYNNDVLLKATELGATINNDGSITLPLNSRQLLIDILGDEASRFQALHKRNVSFTASMHEFMLNQLNGIPTEYNVGVIDDINDFVGNIMGDQDKVKPHDGATFVNPWVVYWENNSLNGEKAGIDKKQFVHFYDAVLGTGGIIKTCGFGVTNRRQRQGEAWRVMLQNMTSYKWLDLNGNPFKITELKDYNGDNIFTPAGEFIVNGKPKTIMYRNSFMVYKVTGISINPDGTWHITRQFGPEKGLNLTQTDSIDVDIDNNYDLYNNVFGGFDSIHIENGQIIEDESSIENMANFINLIGIKTNANSDGKIKTQEDLYQPLKHSDTHYLVGAGAMKLSASNINDTSFYYAKKENGKTVARPYNRFQINMELSGILLDKEHHADESELTMMTLVISACAALGHSLDESTKMYKALASLTRLGIKDYVLPIQELIGGGLDTKELTDTLVRTIIDSMKNGTKAKDGIIMDIIGALQQKALHDKLTVEDTNNIPLALSDPAIRNKVSSLLAVALTSAGIKFKFSGILSVLCPSYDMMKIYGDKMGDAFVKNGNTLQTYQPKYNEAIYGKAIGTETIIDNGQPKEISIYPIKIAQIKIGHTYRFKIGDDYKILLVVFPNEVKGTNNNIRKQRLQNTEVDGVISIFDALNLDKYPTEEIITNGRNLDSFNVIFSDGINTYNFYQLDSVKNAYLNEDRSGIEHDLVALYEHKPVMVNGQLVQVVSHEVQPYEVIMPRTFATAFGITDLDDLDLLSKNYDLFYKKLKRNYAISSDVSLNPKAFSFALKRFNGSHMYILQDGVDTEASLQEVEIIVKPTSKGYARYDLLGNKMYDLASADDKVYQIGNTEIIKTNHPEFYINKVKYNAIESSSSFNGLSSLVNSDKVTSVQAKKLFKDGKDNYNGTPKWFEHAARETWASFNKALDIIAARIPAQSMLSFMPMKVVGFDKGNINTAYVSTHQIWLQGSDYDVDAVSLLTYAISKEGRFSGWSPYFRLDNGIDPESKETINFLEEACKINYPCGEIKELPITTEEDLVKASDQIMTLLTPFAGKKGIHVSDLNIKEYKLFVLNLNYLDLEGLFIGNPDLYNSIAQSLGIDMTGSKKSVEEIIRDIYRNHENYLNDTNAEEFTKNFIVQEMYNIGIDPRNLTQAQVSVDGTTGPVKKIANRAKSATMLNNNTPGNYANKFLAIYENAAGKDGIGISAVGLKCFFALAQYYNQMAERNSVDFRGLDNEKNALFNKTILGHTYHVLANTNFNKTIDNINNSNMSDVDKQAAIKTLRSLSNNETDLAVALSALLSLATDNAKELCLAKLNANKKLMSLYLYGLSIGVDFKDLSGLMMSPLVSTLVDRMKEDVTSGNMGIYKVLDALTQLTSLNSALSSLGFYKIQEVRANSEEELPTARPLSKKSFEDEINVLNNFVTTGNTKNAWEAYKNLVKKVYFIGSKYKGNGLVNNSVYTERFVNNLKLWVKDALVIAQSKNNLTNGQSEFESLVLLTAGAQEFSFLGRVLGINLGLKTSDQDSIAFIEDLERFTIQSHNTHNLVAMLLGYNPDYENIPEQLDLGDFFNDPEYLADIYNDYKDTFNIFDIINKVPHFREYVKSAYIRYRTMQTLSIANREQIRLARHMLDAYYGDLSSTKKKLLLKNISNLIDRKLCQMHMLEQGIIVTIPAGNTIYSDNGESKVVALDTPIRLGTTGGNATFKQWVENEVFPMLKQSLPENKFIQGLTLGIYTRNATGLGAITLQSEVSTMPRTDYDRNRYNVFALDFEALRGTHPYTYKGAKVKIGSIEDGIKLLDLFYWYNAIVYANKMGENTLSAVFDMNTPLKKSFIEWEAKLDKNPFDENGDFTLLDITDDELLYATAPSKTSYSRDEYVKEINDNFQTIIMKKNDDGFGYHPAEDVSYNPNVDANVFINGAIKTSSDYQTTTLDVNTNEGTLKVSIKHKLNPDTGYYECFIARINKDGRFVSAQSAKESINELLKQDSSFLVKYSPDGPVVDTDILLSMLNTAFNCL